MSGDLERRVQRLEDERDIARTLALYGHHADSGNHDAFVDLFTPGAEIELVGGTPSGAHGDNPRWTGQEEIRRYIEDPTMHMLIEGRCMHLPALDLRVEVEGDRATADSRSLVLLREGGQTTVYGAGFTRWSLERGADGWRISRRVRVAIGDDQRSSST